MKPIFSALVCTVLWATAVAYSEPVRCKGRVQFRPCGQPIADGRIAFETVKKPAIKLKRVRPEAAPIEVMPSSQSIPAKIVVRSFERVGGDGLWRGVVTGKGKVRLNLKFAKRGEVREERAVGQVFLSRHKTTTFAVRSTLPSERNLTWHIEAFQDIA